MTGDEFTELVTQHRRMLLAYARQLAGRERAEDVVQTALMRAWRQARGDLVVLVPVPWLRRIVHNAAMDALNRDRARTTVPLLDTDRARDDVAQAVETADELHRALAAIAALPAAQRDVLIAQAVHGVPVGGGAARMLLYRARRTVRAAA
mgnify:FL=1